MEKSARKANPNGPVATFVRAARAATGLTGQAFGEKVQTEKANVSSWEKGLHEPNFDKLMAISRLSGVELPGTGSSTNMRTPVVGDARLGAEGFFEVTPATNGSDGWVLYPWADGQYALRCKGDSMQFRIMHGDYVVIDPSERVFEGYLVAVQTHEGKRMIKTYNRKHEDGSIELTSINNKHDPIVLFPEEIEHMHAVAGVLPPYRYRPD